MFFLNFVRFVPCFLISFKNCLAGLPPVPWQFSNFFCLLTCAEPNVFFIWPPPSFQHYLYPFINSFFFFLGGDFAKSVIDLLLTRSNMEIEISNMIQQLEKEKEEHFQNELGSPVACRRAWSWDHCSS